VVLGGGVSTESARANRKWQIAMKVAVRILKRRILGFGGGDRSESMTYIESTTESGFGSIVIAGVSRSAWSISQLCNSGRKT